MTRPPATAMRTTALRLIQMPSRKTTSWTSSVGGAAGHIRHAQDVLRQKVERPVGSSAAASFESSRARNAASAFAKESILRVADAPQAVQRHLCLPADVLPLPFILAPHAPHLGLPTPYSHHSATFLPEKLD